MEERTSSERSNVSKIIYSITVTIGIFVRQFLLPNPFEFLGAYGVIVNLLVTLAIGPVSFFIVGLIYDRGSFPVFGSILYSIVFSLITIEIWFAFHFNPNWFLVQVVFVAEVIFDVVVVSFIRKNINRV